MASFGKGYEWVAVIRVAVAGCWTGTLKARVLCWLLSQFLSFTGVLVKPPQGDAVVALLFPRGHYLWICSLLPGRAVPRQSGHPTVGSSPLLAKAAVTWRKVLSSTSLSQPYSISCGCSLGVSKDLAPGTLYFKVMWTPLQWHLLLVGGNRRLPTELQPWAEWLTVLRVQWPRRSPRDGFALEALRMAKPGIVFWWDLRFGWQRKLCWHNMLRLL